MAAAFLIALASAALIVSAFSIAVSELVVVIYERAGAIDDGLSLGRSLRHAMPFLGGESVGIARTALVVVACACAGFAARVASRRMVVAWKATA